MDYSSLAKQIRQNIVRMAFLAKNSHVACALSCADILTVLYFGILSIDPKNPQGPRDRSILSKGHAASALYATLAQRGFFPAEVLDSYCKDGGMLPGHCTKDCVPGVEVSTGSLGHGLSIGAGMALAEKRGNGKERVFVLLSDGECDEGALWEAALFASHHELDNLVAIVDYNKFQGFGKTSDILNLEPFQEKWEGFGWAVVSVDGHNYEELERALKAIPQEQGKPTVLVAHTINGKGVSYMENKLEWHYKSPNEEQYQQALEEIRSL